MTPTSADVARAHIAESHRRADEVRAGRRISAERRRARKARKAAERNATAARLQLLVPSVDAYQR